MVSRWMCGAYLADEPMLACPASAGYRLRKFARRYKGPMLAASLVLLALVGGTVTTTWGMIRATDAQQRRNSVPAGQACGAHRVPAYLWAAPPLRSKFKTLE